MRACARHIRDVTVLLRIPLRSDAKKSEGRKWGKYWFCPDCRFARPQLFFKCCLRPKHGREPKNSNYKAGPGIYRYIHVYFSMYVFNHFMPDDLVCELVFFNTFEELNLLIKRPIKDSDVVKLYEPSPTQCLSLYEPPAENMVRRSPLLVCRYFWLDTQL